MHLLRKLQILTKFQDLISGTQLFYWESKSKCQTTMSFAKMFLLFTRIFWLPPTYKKKFPPSLWFLSFGAIITSLSNFWNFNWYILYYSLKRIGLKELILLLLLFYYYIHTYLKNSWKWNESISRIFFLSVLNANF